jgi:hypothetical protein
MSTGSPQPSLMRRLAETVPSLQRGKILLLWRLGGLAVKREEQPEPACSRLNEGQRLHASQHKLGGTAMSARPLTPTSANIVVEGQLDVALAAVETAFKADGLGFVGSMYYGVEDFVRDALENRKNKGDRLIVILDTEGGLIEVVQRIADTLRHHYPQSVEFVVPNYAMSAGTVLVMSGDAIHMDYFSVLGPIDPQVMINGRWVPALGYLEKFNALMAKGATKKGLTDAELAYLASHFDPANLYSYEQAKNLSEQLLKQWLVKYKFKNWDLTETRKKKVTEAMKEKRAKEIADKLNDTKLWNSHARPIPMEVLRRDLNLKIEDFGAIPERRDAVRCYHRLLRDYMARMAHKWAIHATGDYAHIGGAHA